MRQAGRALPPFRRLREEHSFLELCHDPMLAAAVTLLPEPLGVDALVIFSDILIPIETYGVGLSYPTGIGPKIEHPLERSQGVDELFPLNLEALSFVGEAIRRVKRESVLPVIGFAGGPFTLASYLIEGGHVGELKKTKQWMLDDPRSFAALMERLTYDTIRYLKLQVDAGADLLQVFETWLTHLPGHIVIEHVLPHLRLIIEEVRRWRVPLILFSRGPHSPLLARLEPTGVSVDHTVDLQKMREAFPNLVLQGNLDPSALLAPHGLRREVEKILTEREGDRSFIFNLGHGVLPETPVSSLQEVIRIVKGG
jgi:uroporphyrinogen decarboxylase